MVILSFLFVTQGFKFENNYVKVIPVPDKRLEVDYSWPLIGRLVIILLSYLNVVQHSHSAVRVRET